MAVDFFPSLGKTADPFDRTKEVLHRMDVVAAHVKRNGTAFGGDIAFSGRSRCGEIPSEYISPTSKVYYYPVSENIHLDSSLSGNRIKYTLDIDITDANGAYIYENGPKIQDFGSTKIVPFSNKIEAIAFIMTVSGYTLYIPLDMVFENNAITYAVPFISSYNNIVQRTGKIYSLENSIEYIFSTAEEASSKYKEITLVGVVNIIVKEDTPISQEIRL